MPHLSVGAVGAVGAVAAHEMLPDLGGLGWAPLQPTGVPEPNMDWEQLWDELFAKKDVEDIVKQLRTREKEQLAEQSLLVQEAHDADDDGVQDDGGNVLGGWFYGLAPEPEYHGVWDEALQRLRALRVHLDNEQADDKRQLKRYTLSDEIRADLDESIERRREHLELVHKTIEQIKHQWSAAR